MKTLKQNNLESATTNLGFIRAINENTSGGGEIGLANATLEDTFTKIVFKPTVVLPYSLGEEEMFSPGFIDIDGQELESMSGFDSIALDFNLFTTVKHNFSYTSDDGITYTCDFPNTEDYIVEFKKPVQCKPGEESWHELLGYFFQIEKEISSVNTSIALEKEVEVDGELVKVEGVTPEALLKTLKEVGTSVSYETPGEPYNELEGIVQKYNNR